MEELIFFCKQKLSPRYYYDLINNNNIGHCPTPLFNHVSLYGCIVRRLIATTRCVWVRWHFYRKHFGRGQQLCLLEAKTSHEWRRAAADHSPSGEREHTDSARRHVPMHVQPNTADTRQHTRLIGQVAPDDPCWVHANGDAKPALAPLASSS